MSINQLELSLFLWELSFLRPSFYVAQQMQTKLLFIALCVLQIGESLRGCFELASGSTSDFYPIEYTTTNGIKFNATNYCYIDTNGVAWTLIGRSTSGAPSVPFGWLVSTNISCTGMDWYVTFRSLKVRTNNGSVNNGPYSFGLGLYLHSSGLSISDILIGSYTNSSSLEFDQTSTVLRLSYNFTPAPFFESTNRVRCFFINNHHSYRCHRH